MRAIRVLLLGFGVVLLMGACSGRDPAPQPEAEPERAPTIPVTNTPRPPPPTDDQPPARTPPVLTTQQLIERLLVWHGRPERVARVHPCARVSRNPTPSIYRLTPGEDASEFTILEYDSAAAVAERWQVDFGGHARPTAGCFAEAADYAANGNLVVQVPGGSSAAPVLDVLVSLHRPLPGAPLSLLDLALAVEARGETWTGAEEVGLTCSADPDDPDGEGGTLIVPAYHAAIDGQRFLVLAYLDQQRRELEWERDDRGHATSSDCPASPDAVAAGNLVADLIGERPVAGWAAVVDAFAQLDRQRIQPFTTQLLLDELHAFRGGAVVVPGAHPCDGVAAARLTQGEVFAGEPDTRFWVWEYASADALAGEWTVGEDGRATPQLPCAAADGDFVANRNLVVEPPDSTGLGVFDPADLAIAALNAIERSLGLRPYTLGDLARAIDAAGPRWDFLGDSGIGCNSQALELRGVHAGTGWNVSVSDPTVSDASITITVFLYEHPERLALEWEVGANGRAASQQCGGFSEAWAAGNLVVAFEPRFDKDRAGIWPRVVRVMRDLSEQVASSVSLNGHGFFPLPPLPARVVFTDGPPDTGHPAYYGGIGWIDAPPRAVYVGSFDREAWVLAASPGGATPVPLFRVTPSTRVFVSPTGDTVGAADYSSDHPALWLYDVASQRVTPIDQAVRPDLVDWSPDGAHLAVVGVGSVRLVQPDGTVREVDHAARGFPVGLTWAPDGASAVVEWLVPQTTDVRFAVLRPRAEPTLEQLGEGGAWAGASGPSLAIDPTGSRALTVHGDRVDATFRFQLWAIGPERTELRATFSLPGYGPYAAAWVGGLTWLAADRVVFDQRRADRRESGVSILDVNTGSVASILTTETGVFSGGPFVATEDGRRLFTLRSSCVPCSPASFTLVEIDVPARSIVSEVPDGWIVSPAPGPGLVSTPAGLFPLGSDGIGPMILPGAVDALDLVLAAAGDGEAAVALIGSRIGRRVYAINADGSQITVLPPDEPTVRLSGGRTSPSGRFRIQRDPAGFDVLAATSGALIRRVNIRDARAPFFWSPDESRIAFVADSPHERNAYVVDAFGRSAPVLVTVLPVEGDALLGWDQDGRLRYTSANPGP